LLDCTIRDGGHCNQWQFSDECVKQCYKSVSLSGFDYCELGLYQSEEFLDSKFGKWAKLTPEIIRDVRSYYPQGCKVSVLVRLGHLKRITEKVPEIDLLRCTILMPKNRAVNHEFHATMVQKMLDLGYEITLNMTNIDTLEESQIEEIIKSYAHLSIKCLYVADTTGSLDEDSTSYYLNICNKYLQLYNAKFGMGFHAHNNMQNALAKTKIALQSGFVQMVDSTVMGYGRGPGNLCSELLVMHFNDTVFELLKFGDKYIKPLFFNEQPVLYMLAAKLNVDSYYVTTACNRQVPITKAYKFLHKLATYCKENAIVVFSEEVYTIVMDSCQLQVE